MTIHHIIKLNNDSLSYIDIACIHLLIEKIYTNYSPALSTIKPRQVPCGTDAIRISNCKSYSFGSFKSYKNNDLSMINIHSKDCIFYDDIYDAMVKLKVC